MVKTLFLSLVCVYISIAAYSQEDSTTMADMLLDSVDVIDLAEQTCIEIEADTVLFTNFNTNLDKLINLWYIQNSEHWKYPSRSVNGYDTAYIPQFTPDVYRERISKMNSVVPLSYNDQVQAYINVYAFRRRDRVEIMMGLAEYYFPMFEEVFEKNNVPQELKYLAIIESALNPRATSPVGAGGLWQFMPATGRIYNMDITSFVDDRRDPIQSTHAAAKYLSALHKMFGDWTLAIAAYNCGPGNVRKAITRSGGKTDFWAIYPHLPRETRGYVPAYIAAYYVFEHHAEHNLFAREVSFPPSVDTIMITKRLHLQQVSEVLNIPLKLVQDLNPQYRIDIIPESTKGYPLYLPVEYITPFIMFRDSIMAYKDSVFFDYNVIARAPSSANAARSNTVSSASNNRGKTPVYYYVKKGDNLSLIASWYHVNMQDVKSWNNLKSNNIHIGQKLTIYVPSDKKDYYAGVTSMSFAQKQKIAGNSAVAVSTPSAPAPKPTQKSSHSFVYHTVKSGDTLWAIAQKYDNVTVNDIMSLNGLTGNTKITPGMKLKIRTL